jgi:hypothetical protein
LTAPTEKRLTRSLMSEGFAQRIGVVIARRRCRARQADPGIEKARLEEARLAGHAGDEAAMGIARLAENVAVRRERPDFPFGDQFPEGLQLLKAPFRRIAGDDRRVDGADRNARHPIGLDARLVHRLVDAGLVGAERAAALQDQRDAVAPVGAPAFRGTAGTVGQAGADVMHRGTRMAMFKGFAPLPKQVTAE